MAKRLGGIGEVIRIGTERMIVSEVHKLYRIPCWNASRRIGTDTNDRISDLLRWEDHRIYMLILLLDGTAGLTLTIYTMVWDLVDMTNCRL
jgi:hypothetical protein